MIYIIPLSVAIVVLMGALVTSYVENKEKKSPFRKLSKYTEINFVVTNPVNKEGVIQIIADNVKYYWCKDSDSNGNRIGRLILDAQTYKYGTDAADSIIKNEIKNVAKTLQTYKEHGQVLFSQKVEPQKALNPGSEFAIALTKDLEEAIKAGDDAEIKRIQNTLQKDIAWNT